jgi:single-strand DNA-binding protein
VVLPTITIEGNLGADPELRFTPSGAAVCNFRVACTERKKNEQTQQWEDGRQIWFRVTAWREMAENVTESLRRGDAVVVTGRLYTETFQRREGGEGLAVCIDANNVAPSLRNATARAQRTERTGQSGGGQQQAPTWGTGYGTQGGDDPWATPPQGQQQQAQQQAPAQAPAQAQQPAGQPPAQPGWGQQGQQPPPGQGPWGGADSPWGEPPF